jgi:hypothetical protein
MTHTSKSISTLTGDIIIRDNDPDDSDLEDDEDLQDDKEPMVVYTDHSSTVDIASATTLRSIASEKLNPRLVRASQYVQLFRLRVYHRSGKSNKIADALSRLPRILPLRVSEWIGSSSSPPLFSIERLWVFSW